MTPKLISDEILWMYKTYYTVLVYIDSWDMNANESFWQEVTGWSRNSYGHEGSLWIDEAARWYINNGRWWFRDEADRTLFLLRWS